jgi:hypothetical protein
LTEYPRHWTCEDTVLHLEAYLLRTLRVADSLALAAHVEACAPCFQLLTLRVEQRPPTGPAGSERPTRAPHG